MNRLNPVLIAIKEVIPKPWKGIITYKVSVKEEYFVPRYALNHITFTIKMSCTAADNQAPFLYYTIEKSDYLVNGLPPKTAFDYVIRKGEEVLDKLQIKQMIDGTYIEAVNLDEIREVWKEKKKDITLRYTGDVVDRFIAMRNAKLDNDEKVQEAIERNPFINCYFCNFYHFYGVDKEATGTHMVGGLLWQKITFNTVNHIRMQDKVPKSITVNGKLVSDVIDLERCNRSLKSRNIVVQSTNELKGDLKATYFLDSGHQYIQKVNSEQSLFIKGEEYHQRTIKIHRL
ncbi:hypothetical protein [Sinomicrobium weinanense]|uniref:Uncharacterized protein n=1 Tax=Sinomicrobium weinanense TaxID=2842200 RepID=A0A926Q5I1_9FLAO|nr:hypothetical protein [Sinomicrobium weinanense]MBC9798191.1 hypothetical protein [Sinomicrobium weinanense]MBU3125483.1 hypothetical protein [Sinomicrobium weinanense]